MIGNRDIRRKYAIRKSTLGVGSVLIASLLFAGQVQAAEEVAASPAEVSQTTAEPATEGEASEPAATELTASETTSPETTTAAAGSPVVSESDNTETILADTLVSQPDTETSALAATNLAPPSLETTEAYALVASTTILEFVDRNNNQIYPPQYSNPDVPDSQVIESVTNELRRRGYHGATTTETILGDTVKKITSYSEIIDYLNIWYNAGLPKSGEPVWPNDPFSPVYPSTLDSYQKEIFEETRVIHFVDQNGNTLAESIIQIFPFENHAEINIVTGEITEGTARVVSAPPLILPPYIEGYIPTNWESVPYVSAYTGPLEDYYVIYTPTESQSLDPSLQTANIMFKNIDGSTRFVQTVQGKSGEKLPQLTPTLYDRLQDEWLSYKYSDIDNLFFDTDITLDQTFEVQLHPYTATFDAFYFIHDYKPVAGKRWLSKAPTPPFPDVVNEFHLKDQATRTIHLLFEDGSIAMPATSEVKDVSRGFTLNFLTEEYSYGDWTTLTTFSDYIVPTIEGYQSDIDFIKGTDVIDNNLIQVYTVTYRKTQPTTPVDMTKDTDGDGIPDYVELNGVTDKNGQMITPLHLMGANPLVKDIFLEVDFTDLGLVGADKVAFENAVRQTFAWNKQQFANKGIRLHIDAGKDYEDITGTNWSNIPQYGNQQFGGDLLTSSGTFNSKTWVNTLDKTIINNRPVYGMDRERSYFRHALFTDTIDGSNNLAGLGQVSAPRFLLASNLLKEKNLTFSPIQMAVTFMHELGHTLGLGHGYMYPDEPNFTENTSLEEIEAYRRTFIDARTNNKVNHLSIMNYSYSGYGLRLVSDQGRSIKADANNIYKIMDYSNYALPALDEKALNESVGIDPNLSVTDPRLGMAIYDEPGKLLIRSIHNDPQFASAIDYNRNGKIDDLPVDVKINNYINSKDVKETTDRLYKTDPRLSPVTENDIRLQSASANEWENLRFKVGNMGREYSLFTYDDIIVETPDWGLEEYKENGLLGQSGSAFINRVLPGTLYTGLPGQTIKVDVANLHNTPTTAKVIIQSDLLAGGQVESTVDLLASIDNFEISSLNIPVKSALTAGTYQLKVILETQDGLVQDFIMPVVVSNTASINLRVGQVHSLTPLNNRYIYVIEDSSILSNPSSDMLYGLKSGQTWVKVMAGDNVVDYFLVNVAPADLAIVTPPKEEQNPQGQLSGKTETPSHTATPAPAENPEEATPTPVTPPATAEAPQASHYHASQVTLPNTGEDDMSLALFSAASLSILAGLGLIHKKKESDVY